MRNGAQYEKKTVEIFSAVSCICPVRPHGRGGRRGEEMVRVGLAYGSGALVGANLENNTGYGSGYRFGYFDEDLRFEELGRPTRKRPRSPC